MRFNRPIAEFTGSAAVIGCTHDREQCRGTHHFHDNEKDFYTIDIEAKLNPDLVFDLSQKLPPELNQRFQLVIAEALPCYAYNDCDFAMNYAERGGAKGFDNLFNMASDDGFILISGCPRLKETRQQLSIRHLRYCELNADGASILLVPKNQTLSIEAIKAQIDRLAPALQAVIEKAKSYKNTTGTNPDLSFCTSSYEEMPTLHEHCKMESEKAGQKIAAFKKIYAALFEGQTSFFKRRVFGVNALALTEQQIERYARANPSSRTAKAWELAKIHFTQVSATNTALFTATHQYAAARSGLFKRSASFSGAGYSDLSTRIAHASAGSRTEKIARILGERSGPGASC